jgi:hypothetical protein
MYQRSTESQRPRKHQRTNVGVTLHRPSHGAGHVPHDPIDIAQRSDLDLGMGGGGADPGGYSGKGRLRTQLRVHRRRSEHYDTLVRTIDRFQHSPRSRRERRRKQLCIIVHRLHPSKHSLIPWSFVDCDAKASATAPAASARRRDEVPCPPSGLLLKHLLGSALPCCPSFSSPLRPLVSSLFVPSGPISLTFHPLAR